MSSDDYMLIRKHDGRYAVTREFASDEEPSPSEIDRGLWFDNLGAAILYANGERTEYGIEFGDTDDVLAADRYWQQGMVAAFYYTKLGRLPPPHDTRIYLLEELSELTRALAFENYEAQLKELVDVLYAAYGYVISRGWNLTEAFVRVHASNMTKEPTTGGKIKKGADYLPPDLSGCLGTEK